MNIEKKRLTRSEEQMMDIFWSSNEPLTSVDIINMKVKKTWNGGLVYNMLRSLKKKGMLKECGDVRYVTQHAKQFVPVISKEEYAAKMVLSMGIQKSAVSKVVLALAKEEGEDMIEELEEIIKELSGERGEEQ